MDQKTLNFFAIKQNKSENKVLLIKPLIAEEQTDATTVATSKMNSEEDQEMSHSSQNMICLETEKIEDPALLRLNSSVNSSVSSDDYILTASILEDEDWLSTQGPAQEERIDVDFSSPTK